MPADTDIDPPARHALIIEDEILVGLDVQCVLAEIGFTSFAFASTALQAMEQGRLRRPDIVTADVNLLDGDGVTVAHALRKVHGRLPIIYVTGDLAAVRDLEDAVVVAKPFVPADLSAACLRLLAGLAAPLAPAAGATA